MMEKLILLLMVITSILIVGILIFIILFCIKLRYKRFILKNSVAIKKLKDINSSYNFKTIAQFSFIHSYDNYNFYSDISCKDYLVYQLVYKQNKVRTAIKECELNRTLYEKYKNEINRKCIFENFGEAKKPKNKKRLLKLEKQIFAEKMLKPVLELQINVQLINTKINGRYVGQKQKIFDEETIKNILQMLNQKNGNFYLNSDIWQSICRVERGKVTNKLRFAIYNRDRNRCRKCGSRYNLEIDHIIPIAKGGKTEYSNLQTLCHKCNCEKGDKLY